MARLLWTAVAGVAALACSTPPNTCDQAVADDVASYIGTLAAHASVHNQAWQLAGPFACPRGGSGTANIAGQAGFWNGSIGFQACELDADALTVTGTVTMRGDQINGVDWGSAATLTLRGSVDGCARPVDETCALSWAPMQDENDPSYYRSGTLCGRHFP